MSIQHQESLEGGRLPSAGTPGFCPCQEEGNEEGEQDRGKANESQGGEDKGIAGQKTNTGEEGTTCAAQPSFQSNLRPVSQPLLNK